MTESEITEKMRKEWDPIWVAGAEWAARRCAERLEKRADEMTTWEGDNVSDQIGEALMAEARAIKKEWGLE
jgi:hypothetical protein